MFGWGELLGTHVDDLVGFEERSGNVREDGFWWIPADVGLRDGCLRCVGCSLRVRPGKEDGGEVSRYYTVRD